MEIKQLLLNEDVSAVITELKAGRNATEPNQDLYEKQIDPLKHDVMNPVKRPDKKVKIDASAGDDGNKVITVSSADSEESFRIEPVARVALSLQKLIVKRAVAFTFGNPVNLNSEPEDDNEKTVLKAVKRVLFDTKSRTLNRKVARAIFSSTEAAEYWYPVESQNEKYGFKSKYKLRVAIFSPYLGDKLYPYFDETGDMVAFSRQFVRKDNAGVKYTYFETYTAEEHRMWITTNSGWQLVEGYPKVNVIGKIPVIYGRQPSVEWEDVQGLIDRLEKLLSNFADTNDYHASPKIFTTGEILGWAKKGESGAVIQGEEGSTAQYLAWQNAPESVKLEIETLLRMIYTITQTPDISFDSVKGIGSVSGVALKLLFLDAHLKVQDKMEVFDDYLQRRLSVIQAFLGYFNTSIKAATESLTIEPEIVPFMIEDERANVDLLVVANGGKPIISQKTSVAQLGWVNDTEAEYSLIQEEGAASAYTDITEPTI